MSETGGGDKGQTCLFFKMLFIKHTKANNTATCNKVLHLPLPIL